METRTLNPFVTMFNKPTFRTVAFLSLVVLTSSTLEGQRIATPTGASPSKSVFGLGIDFVENRGQWDGPAVFVAQLGHAAAALEPRAIRLRLAGERPADVSLVFEGASKLATVAGEEQRRGVYNFFVGNDRRRWQSNVPAFGGVRYRGLYDGVDVRVLQRQGRLEYDVLLRPHADLDQVVIHAVGVQRIEISADGVLTLQTAAGPLHQTAPVT